MRRRLIIDLTDIWPYLAHSDRVAGIQRVVLKQAKHLLARDGIETLLGYYDPQFGIYAHFPLESRLDDPEALIGALQPRHFRSLRPHKYVNRPLAFSFHRAHTRIVALARRLLSGNASLPKRLSLREGDIVLSIGTGWEAANMYNLILPMARKGKIQIVPVIHDITPLLDIDGQPAEWNSNFFHVWLSGIAPYVSGYVSVSQNTSRDLLWYLKKIDQAKPSIETISLACDFQPDRAEPVAKEIDSLALDDYVLAVISNTARRKNLSRLLETWVRLAGRLGRETVPRLVIAGGIVPGDLPESILDRLGDLFRLVSRPNDTELGLLYGNALFSVYPSTYEGWGLPVGESLWLGKFCVTSNAASMPEVGGAFCDYFDPLDIDSMAAAIERPILDRAYLAEREAAIDRKKLVSWEQSAAMLRDAVMRIADRD